jgi:hypothetical protein
MHNKNMKMTVARAGVVISALAIVILVASSGDGYTNPVRYVLNALGIAGIGVNFYFVFKFLRALGCYRRKRSTVVIGALWLVAFVGVMGIVGVLGFAEGAGGGGYGSPSAASWLGALATLGVGAVFSFLLSKAHKA